MGKFLTQKEFLEKAKAIHGDKYDYSKTVYINAKTKVNIICPIHSEFSIRPSNHLKGQGCSKCSMQKRIINQTLTTKKFIEKATKIHKNKYNYSKVNYINSQTKIIIICPLHGDFEQIPNSHITAKTGCRLCSLVKNDIFYNTDIFIQKAEKVHDNLYDYSLVKYISNQVKVKIICKEHGVFSQRPSGHLSGNGCFKCNHISVFTKTSWVDICNYRNYNPVVYIIRCFNKNENFIKIGITTKKIHRRFSGKVMPYSYEVIKEIKGSPDFLYDKEHELHRLYKKDQYKPLISFPGQTECFNISILDIITNQ